MGLRQEDNGQEDVACECFVLSDVHDLCLANLFFSEIPPPRRLTNVLTYNTSVRWALS